MIGDILTTFMAWAAEALRQITMGPYQEEPEDQDRRSMGRLRQTRGEFDNYVIPGSEHWQQSKFEAWPGDWGYACSHGGDPPGPLDWVCYADRYLLP